MNDSNRGREPLTCARAVIGGLIAAAILSAITPVVAAPAAGVAPADTVFDHGFIYTVDPQNSVRQAIAIRGGTIVYVGTNEGVRAYVGQHTKLVDLHGRMVMPGIIDAHNHAIFAGQELNGCDLHYAQLTIPQMQHAIQACLDKTRSQEPNTYLRVWNWYQEAMQPAGVRVTKGDLDVLKTRRPIIVQSSFGHTTLANSRAIALAGITRDTPDPRAGHIDRDASGAPTGTFDDAAQTLIDKAIPPLTARDIRDAAKAALAAFRQQGETAFMLQIATRADIQAFATLRKDGLLTARAYMAPDISPNAMVGDPQVPVRHILALKAEFDTGAIGPEPNLWVRNAGELFQDGVQQVPAESASLLSPYFVNKGTKAKPDWVPGTWSGPAPYTPAKPFERILLALANAGIEPEVHAIGDRAIRHTLNAYAYVRQHLHGRDVRLEIAHAEIVAPSDIPRFKELNVIPDMAFQWAKPGPDSLDTSQPYIGMARSNRQEPEGYFDQIGVPVAQGSDWPVDPLETWFDLQVLVTREGDWQFWKHLGPKYQGRFGTVPLVPLKDGIRFLTINGAYALHSEKSIGSLEKGKLADLIVLDRNLFKTPVDRIEDTKVLLTMVGGKTVYRAAPF
ncbi:MAG: amidohydrolase [Gammaproteobacteria bacterium]|nr:amidohydrolase [Gammaproteobacteria bacterium]